MQDAIIKNEKKHPMFSVIVPIFNTEKFLAECLESLLNQSFNDFEIVCVDGGSSDRSRVVVRQFCEKDSRVRLLEESCVSAGAARNAGLDAAEGKYVVFVDSDDYIEKNMLETLFQTAEKERADIVCFPCRRYNSNTNQMLDG